MRTGLTAPSLLALGVLLYLLLSIALMLSRRIFSSQSHVQLRRNLIAFATTVVVVALICALVAYRTTSETSLAMMIVVSVFGCPMFLLVGISIFWDAVAPSSSPGRVSTFWRTVFIVLAPLVAWPGALLFLESRGRAFEFYAPVLLLVVLMVFTGVRGRLPGFLLQRL